MHQKNTIETYENTDLVLTDNMNDIIYWVDLVRNMRGICIAGLMHIVFLPNTYVTSKRPIKKYYTWLLGPQLPKFKSVFIFIQLLIHFFMS